MRFLVSQVPLYMGTVLAACFTLSRTVTWRNGEPLHGETVGTISPKNNYLAEMYSTSKEGSYVRLTDVCITQR